MCSRSGRLRSDGQIAVSLADGAGGQELIRLSDPATGRPSGRPAPHYPGWIVACGRLQPRRPMFRDGEQPSDSLRRRAQTLGREHGPVAASAFAATPTGSRRWPSSPTARSWPRAIMMDSSGSGIPPLDGRWAGRFLKERWSMSLAYSPDGTMIAVGLASERATRARSSGIPGRANASVRYCRARATSPGSSSGRMVAPCSRVSRSLHPPVGHEPSGQAIWRPD